MLLYISILGIILSSILFFFNVKLFRSAVYLAGFLFLSTLVSLNIYVLYYSKSVLLVSIVLVYTKFSLFLNGPMLYWYIRSTLTDNPRLKRIDILHLVPAAFFFLTSLPYIFAPASEKARIASELMMTIDNIMISDQPVLFYLIPAKFVFLAQLFHALVYFIVSARMLASYLKTGKKNHVLSGQRIVINWLTVLISFLLILTISSDIIMIKTVLTKDSGLFYTLNILTISTTIGLVGLMVSPLFFPYILYGLPRFPAASASAPGTKEEIRPDTREDSKLKAHAFEDDYLLQIEGIIDSFMREQKPWLKNDFNLTQLSGMINIPVHHLAYFFRENLKQSFHDYRNKWRVEYSKKLIREGKVKEITLEAIGRLSGFSSRNTFFIAFKRAEGMSPSEFASRFNN